MYSYDWDPSTGGYILNSTPLNFSKEPRPVYYKELDMLGFDRYWDYEKDDTYPYMWAEANTYWYRGRKIAQTKGGSLCSPPEIAILEEAEPQGGKLRFVDVPAMVSKNAPFMEGFVQETIKKVYNTYVEYQKKADVFYVAFSGGKDSIVTLDIVQRALPHNAFKVLFGMMFPFENTVAIEKYWLSFDFKFTLPPSGRLNSTAPSHWLMTLNNVSRLEMFFIFNFMIVTSSKVIAAVPLCSGNFLPLCDLFTSFIF